MTVFWLLATPLALILAWLLLWPLWRGRDSKDSSMLALNARVFRERLQELETDLREGRIDAETFEGLKTELERGLLSAEQSLSEVVPVRTVHSRLRLALLVLLPASALGFYGLVQLDPELPKWWQQKQLMAPVIDTVLSGKVPEANAPEHTLPDFIRALQLHMQATPENAEGWFVLGISYLQLNMPEQAMQAFERAWRLEPKRPDVALAYAQTQIFNNGGALNRQSRALIEDVLQQYPEHEGALLLLGMGAFRAQDYVTAASALAKLQTLRQPHADPSSAASQQVASLLAEARAALAQSADSKAAKATAIVVSVRLDKSLMAKAAPDDTVFIFARALKGPPMPLAAVRRKVAELPLQISLDDSQSMLPTLKLSAFNEVVVGARISRSGQVAAQVGDLEAVAVPLQQDGKSHRVDLLIQSERR